MRKLLLGCIVFSMFWAFSPAEAEACRRGGFFRRSRVRCCVPQRCRPPCCEQMPKAYSPGRLESNLQRLVNEWWGDKENPGEKEKFLKYLEENYRIIPKN